MRSSNRAALDAMIAEATVDCYNDRECITGFCTMLDEHLDMPLQTVVLRAEATVTGIDLTDDEQIVVLAAALFAHDSAGFRVHDSAWLGEHRLMVAGAGVVRGRPPGGGGRPLGVVAWRAG